MGLMRFVIWWIFCCDILIGFTQADTQKISDTSLARSLQDGSVEGRRKIYQLQLLFPLLLQISSKLGTLVPTALMALGGVFLFVLFSKKALLISLFALFLSLGDKLKNNKDELVIHKINSYEDYNDEEHYYYHSPSHRPWKKHKKYKPKIKVYRKSDPYPNIYDTPYVMPFKPLSQPENL